MNHTTELVMLLDRSGSMCDLVGDTIGGFNAMLAKHKQQEGRCLLTTVLFNGQVTRLHDRVDIAEVAPLTEEDYRVGGSTSLLDAIGLTIQHISSIHRYIRPEDVPDHTLFVITTDGYENTSRSFTRKRVKEMIEEAREEKGWDFLFLAANLDAVETAGSYGIAADRSSSFQCSGSGVGSIFAALTDVLDDVRADRPLRDNWDGEIERD